MIANGEEEMDEQDAEESDGHSQDHELYRHGIGEGGQHLCEREREGGVSRDTLERYSSNSAPR